VPSLLPLLPLRQHQQHLALQQPLLLLQRRVWLPLLRQHLLLLRLLLQLRWS
jgi:hypothetical protein